MYIHKKKQKPDIGNSKIYEEDTKKPLPLKIEGSHVINLNQTNNDIRKNIKGDSKESPEQDKMVIRI